MSEDTIVLDRDDRYKMLGAQNLNGITCFLNATLFAMFCRSDSCFDKLLYSALDGAVGRFATMVRLWVNMLRSGWFISSDIVAVSTFVDRAYGSKYARTWRSVGGRWPGWISSKMPLNVIFTWCTGPWESI
jgi:hypothetical protein